jgi:hypothetical protein
MEKIIKFLADYTGGTSYKSYKYCFDAVAVPSIVYDDNQDISIARDQIGETDRGLKKSKSLHKLAQNIKPEPPLFRFFLDGSRRTYKVDDIAYGDRIYPIIAGQIGIGCCERKSPDHFKSVALKKQIVIVLPDCADKDGNNKLFFNNLREKINKLNLLSNRRAVIEKILSYPDVPLKEGEKYENKGIAKIQDEMVESEKKMVVELVERGKLNVNSYLIKDGSLEYKKIQGYVDQELSKIKSNYRCVVGVSKLFNPELCKDKNKKNIAKQIAELKLYHRTPAFKYTNERAPGVEFSIWYLRIREINRTISPFDGILKVEKILISDDEQNKGLESDEIDLISANLINERCPTCYGSDSRWANHLYPVYLTEQFIKSNYLSESYFLSLF